VEEESDSSTDSESSDDASDGNEENKGGDGGDGGHGVEEERDLGLIVILGLEGSGQAALMEILSLLPGAQRSVPEDDSLTFSDLYSAHGRIPTKYRWTCKTFEIKADAAEEEILGLLEQTQQAKAFIFLVDASDESNLRASGELNLAVSPLLEAPYPPLLVLATNRDLPG